MIDHRVAGRAEQLVRRRHLRAATPILATALPRRMASTMMPATKGARPVAASWVATIRWVEFIDVDRMALAGGDAVHALADHPVDLAADERVVDLAICFEGGGRNSPHHDHSTGMGPSRIFMLP